MPNNRRNARARDYSITPILSNNPFSVSARTMTARIPCHDWKPSETLSRGDTTRERVWPLLGPSRAISGVITHAYQSIGSTYQSNCINGYRQESHDVISQCDSSNVPKHQVSLQLNDIENQSQQKHQVSLKLHDHDKDSYQNPIMIMISIENRSRSEFVSTNNTIPYHDQLTITIRIAPQNSITIRISIDIRS